MTRRKVSSKRKEKEADCSSLKIHISHSGAVDLIIEKEPRVHSIKWMVL